MDRTPGDPLARAAMREHRRQVDALLEAALDRPAEERDAFLDAACGGDAALRRAVSELLAAAALASHEFLAGNAASATAALLGDPFAPERIGPYRVDAELGRGGMGVVYLAERDDGQFRRRVAIKLLQHAAHTPELQRRFLAERQILATLDHPNIARLLDGGLTTDGRPYLVMEYVDGAPIDEYCDRWKLPIADRLVIFRDVARAVQYAHRNLIVHRDLKPSNILVGADGVPKLLDFGIAKMLDPALLQTEVPQTHTGHRLMTPEYASPEQIAGESVTTGSDVYALGVVLFVLLTGCLPFPRSGRPPREHEQAVLSAPPPWPSEVVFRPPPTPSDTSPEARAAARRTTPRRLQRELRGDLDRIVHMALRKEPDRRYRAAEQLAEDVQRHLAGRPVSARADSAAYRARKFAARHRWAVGAAAGLVVTLAGYAGTVTVHQQRIRAALDEVRLEADRSEELTEVLLRLFEVPRGSDARADSAAVARLLARGVARASQLHNRPEARAQMLATLGRVYTHLGNYDRAATLLEEAVALRRSLHGARHVAVSESLIALADVYHRMDRMAEADTLLREALATQQAILGDDDARVARTLTEIARLRRDEGDLDSARALARDALARQRRLFGADHPDVAASLDLLAGVLRRQGDLRAAGPLYREALAMRRRLYAGDHVDVAESLNNLAVYFERTGNVAAAEPLYREALGMYRRLLGDAHPSVAATMSNLGIVVGLRGDAAGAERLLEDGLALRRQLYGDEHLAVAEGLRLLGIQYYRRGAYVRAESAYAASLKLERRLVGDRHPEVALSLHGLGRTHRALGRLSEAETELREALAIRRELLGSAHPFTANSMYELGVVLRARGSFSEAEALFREALQTRRRLLGDRAADVAETARALVGVLEAEGRPRAADPYRALARG